MFASTFWHKQSRVAITRLDSTSAHTLEIIRSSRNAAIRRLLTLRNNRRRRAEGAVLVDGARETLRAIESGLTLRAFYEPVNASGDTLIDVDGIEAARQHASEIGVHRGVSTELFAKICYGDAQQRCVAEFTATDDSVTNMGPPPPGVILVLDRVEKPGNIGAVFRTADAAGVAAVLLCDCPSDRFNSNAIRSSLGAVFTVPSGSGTQAEVNEYLSRYVDDVYSMRVEGASSFYDADLRADRVAVILGSEADGLGDRWLHFGQTTAASQSDSSSLENDSRLIQAVKLPMAGRVDSLNVSVSAAIVAFEAVRQRH